MPIAIISKLLPLRVRHGFKAGLAQCSLLGRVKAAKNFMREQKRLHRVNPLLGRRVAQGQFDLVDLGQQGFNQ